MTKFKSIGEAWDSYKKDVLAGAPPHQLRDMELCFYGAASAMFSIVRDMEGSDEECMEFLAKLEREIYEHQQKMLAYLRILIKDGPKH